MVAVSRSVRRIRKKTLPQYVRDAVVFAPVPFELATVQIQGATFFKPYAGGQYGREQQPLFKDLNLTIDHPSKERWAVVGPAGAGKSTFLELLRGRYTCEPHGARRYPALEALAKMRELKGSVVSQIQYIGTPRREGQLAGVAAQGGFVGARYESGREASDLTLRDYLNGNTSLNPDPSQQDRFVKEVGEEFYHKLIQSFYLEELIDQPLSSLSNGQVRRAQFTRALMPRPGMLLADEPFTGMDPLMQAMMLRRLLELSKKSHLSIVTSFLDSDVIPYYVTHLLYLNAQHEIVAMGERGEAGDKVREAGLRLELGSQHVPYKGGILNRRPPLERRDRIPEDGSTSTRERWYEQYDSAVCVADKAPQAESRPTVIELSGVRVRYGDRTVLGNGEQDVDGERRAGLWWQVKQGERWAVFGANGAGKTTLFSLINSDHPQAYSEPVRVFGRSRLPSPGEPALSVFELQSQIGQSSPEIHNFFPRHLSVRQSLESAWAETFRSPPSMTADDDEMVDAYLRWFQPHLDTRASTNGDRKPSAISQLGNVHDIETYINTPMDWADEVRFGDLTFGQQRMVLFLRAIIRQPRLIMLDEAFGGMSAGERVACMLWLAYGETKVTLAYHFTGGLKRPSVLATFPSGLKRQRLRPVRFAGMLPEQTLLCIAHQRDDVPPLINRWIALPSVSGDMDMHASLKQALKGERGPPPKVMIGGEGEVAERGQIPQARFGKVQFLRDQWHETDWWDDVWLGADRRKVERRVGVHV